MRKRIFLLCASQSKTFVKQIAARLKPNRVEIIKADIRKFRDGEFSLQLKQDVQGKVIFIVQRLVVPGTNTHENILELLLLNSLVRLYKPKKIINVIPYLPYTRQDRILHKGEGLSIQSIGNLLKASGADQLLVMDIHSLLAKELLPLPTVTIGPAPVFALYLQQHHSNVVIVSPDKGAMQRCREVARLLRTDVTYLEKTRPRPGEAKVRHVWGDVKGKTVVLIDDMIDSGGTLEGAVISLRDAGAKKILAMCTHAIFSDPAPERIKRCKIRIVSINTIPRQKHVWHSQLDASGLFADAIKALS